MIDFNNAIAVIRDNNSFTPNDYDDSFYRVYNTPRGTIQVRISNHGTHLWTWVKNAPVNPSQCYANICIVLSENGMHNSSVAVAANKYHNNDNNPVGKPYSFEVIQYVYNCTLLSMKHASIINKRVMEIPKNLAFIDPLKTDRDRHAGIYKLSPNQPIQTVVSQSFIGIGPKEMIPQNIAGDKARPATQKSHGADYPIEESNINNQKIKENRNMNKKQVIRINENQLRKIVTESVERVIREYNDYYQSDNQEEFIIRFTLGKGIPFWVMKLNMRGPGYKHLVLTDDISEAEHFDRATAKNIKMIATDERWWGNVGDISIEKI